MLAYQNQDSDLTFAEGVAEYYAAHPFLKRGDALSAEARAFFRCHDAIHVLYGCDTTLTQEAIVKLSSIFGTTGGMSVLKGYALHDSIDIYRQLKISDIVATILASFVVVPRTLWRCARQKARWPWSDFTEFETASLAELRRRFGIRVVR